MGKPKGKEQKVYTFKDYLETPDGVRWEIIDGVVYDMTPSPLRIHQEISGELYLLFRAFFDKLGCKVYTAPFGVRVPQNDEADEFVQNYVEPDLTVVCDRSKLDDRGCRGAPDLIVEFLSPLTASKDHIIKKALYERAGVREFWLIDPANRLVTTYVLDEAGHFGPARIQGSTANIRSAVFPDLLIDFATVFPPLEPVVRDTPFDFVAPPSPRKAGPARKKPRS